MCRRRSFSFVVSGKGAKGLIEPGRRRLHVRTARHQPGPGASASRAHESLRAERAGLDAAAEVRPQLGQALLAVAAQLRSALLRNRATWAFQGIERWPRDSNPRGGCPPTRSPGVPLRPLGQATAVESSGGVTPNGRPSEAAACLAEAAGFEPVRGGLGP